MSLNDGTDDEPDDDPPRTNWADRVRYSRRGGGYAFRPHQIHCADTDALNAVKEITAESGATSDLRIPMSDGQDEWLHFFEGAEEDVFEQVRDRGVRAEPNYVLFAHPVYASPVYASPVYASPVYASPVYANPVYANPVYASPVYASPVYASPVYASPVYASPVYANAYICSGERPSTARPARAPTDQPLDYDPDSVSGPNIVIVDTGIARADFCPNILAKLIQRYPGAWEIPDGTIPNHQKDGFLDPASGHGTYIAGLVHALTPGRPIVPVRAVSSYGDVDVLTVVRHVNRLIAAPNTIGDRTVVNLSFGGYADEHMWALARAVRRLRTKGAVVVASAGNDATTRPMFPACLPGVVGVAALDPYGPAPYSNHGPWVRACAPGSDLVAAFYRYDGRMEEPAMPGSADPDCYEGWARWTGTSFAAPVVSAALVRHMTVTGCTAKDAVSEVIDAPGLFRLPDLGAVVNLVPPDPGCLS